MNRALRGSRLPAMRLALVVSMLAASPLAQALGAERPNIVVIVADDLGWNDVGYHGSEILTPNLDRLADTGVKLEHHYVWPTCSPTRTALLTSRNPSRFDVLGPIGGRSEQAVPPATLTLADVLKSQGYECAIAGKWHLGLRPEVGPKQYGFDSTYGYLHGQIAPYTHLYKNGDRTWHRDDQFIDEKGHATDLLAAEATRWIEARHAGPFFLYMTFSVPHVPLDEVERWTKLYNGKISTPSRKLYAAAVTHMDDAIGRVVAALDRQNLRKNTLILFTSDNGGQKNHETGSEYAGAYGSFPVLGNNTPLRGWKGDLYEGGVRVPALLNWPGTLKPRSVDAPLSALDWLPTFATLTGAASDARSTWEGVDAWPAATGKAELAPRTLYWKVPRESAVRSGDWKLIVGTRGPARAELYNVATDPLETTDLAAKHPERVAALRATLEQQQKLDP